MPRPYGPWKYAPLTAYLAALTVDEVTLTLAEIETIIAAPLPRAASSASFWSNSQLGVLRSQPWVQVGWRVRRTKLHARPPAVHFARAAPRAAD
jgi:hypothetical protein